MSVIIRPAVADDASAIAQVHVTAWQIAYRSLVPQEYLDSLDIMERTQLWHSILVGDITVEGIPRPADFVAESNGALVGFANVGRFRDEPGNTQAGELWTMYLSPDHWGTGVADALMAATLEQLEQLGFSVSYLWVLEGNERARRFYERHGWSPDDMIKSFEVGGASVPEIRYSRQVS